MDMFCQVAMEMQIRKCASYLSSIATDGVFFLTGHSAPENSITFEPLEFTQNSEAYEQLDYCLLSLEGTPEEIHQIVELVKKIRDKRNANQS